MMPETLGAFRVISILVSLLASWTPFLPAAIAFAPLRLIPSSFAKSYLASSSSNDNDDLGSSLFDMNELQKRMDQQMTQYYDLFMEEEESDSAVRPEFVYIIVFNPGEQQGVHTIEFPKNSGNNVILAFESDDECIDFAQMLKNMQFFHPIPQMANLNELEVFCQGIGVPVKVIPRGKSLRPPADNVEELDMNPYLHRDQQRLNQAFLDSMEKSYKDDTSEESAWE